MNGGQKTGVLLGAFSATDMAGPAPVMHPKRQAHIRGPGTTVTTHSSTSSDAHSAFHGTILKLLCFHNFQDMRITIHGQVIEHTKEELCLWELVHAGRSAPASR